MKYVIFSDIHFGCKSNSEDFNKECLDFLDFVINKTKDMEIDGCIFGGDWFHNRNTINVKTLQMGVEGLYKLAIIGKGNSYLILGNHDLYYRNKRDVHSIVVPEGEIGIEVIDEPIMINDILLCPWLVGDESLKDLIQNKKPKYVVGHFEIPSFSLNHTTKLEGEYDPKDYEGPKRIISGHFHVRSEKNNITYIGNCFSHDFSDVDECHNKGFCILDTETNDLTYYEWDEAPKYFVYKISELSNIQFLNNMNIKLINDINLKPLELNQIKEQLENIPQIKQCIMIPSEISNFEENTNKNIEKLDNINDLILELLSQMDMDVDKKQNLIRLYGELEDE